jgi:hypothetical protein
MAGIMQMMMGSSPLAGAITCDSADFDGTNDYMTRGADLTGSADGKKGIFSGWLRIDGGNGGDLGIIVNHTSLFATHRAENNILRVFGSNSVGATILDLRTSNTYLSGASWIHMLASWDLATAGARHIYINDVSDLVQTTFTNDNIAYAQTNWGCGARPNDATQKFNGCLAEIYFTQGQYLDFSIADNRRKFITPGLKPADLGPDGSAPLGFSPMVYLRLGDGQAASNFATNLGTGGNFSITGSLDTGSTSPSD